MKQDLRQDLARTAFIRHIPEERIFATLPTTVEAYQEWAEKHPTAG
jgi:hypothetical protein